MFTCRSPYKHSPLAAQDLNAANSLNVGRAESPRCRPDHHASSSGGIHSQQIPLQETLFVHIGLSNGLGVISPSVFGSVFVAASRPKGSGPPRVAKSSDESSPPEFGSQLVASRYRSQRPCTRNRTHDRLQNVPSLRDSLVHLTGDTRPVGPFAAWATFATPAPASTAEHLPGTTAIGFDEDDSRGHCGGAPECKSTPSESDKRFVGRQ